MCLSLSLSFPSRRSLNKTWFTWPFRLHVEWATCLAGRSYTKTSPPGTACKWPLTWIKAVAICLHLFPVTYRWFVTNKVTNFFFPHFLSGSIDDNMQVKITDNALARDLFPMDYHCLGDNENRPVRWMALESLLNNDFSSASDVVRTATYHALAFPVFQGLLGKQKSGSMIQRRWCRKWHQLYRSHS